MIYFGKHIRFIAVKFKDLRLMLAVVKNLWLTGGCKSKIHSDASVISWSRDHIVTGSHVISVCELTLSNITS